MNHIDFVLWVVGWAVVMGLQPIGTYWRAVRHILLSIIWIAIAIMLWNGST